MNLTLHIFHIYLSIFLCFNHLINILGFHIVKEDTKSRRHLAVLKPNELDS